MVVVSTSCCLLMKRLRSRERCLVLTAARPLRVVNLAVGVRFREVGVDVVWVHLKVEARVIFPLTR